MSYWLGIVWRRPSVAEARFTYASLEEKNKEAYTIADRAFANHTTCMLESEIRGNDDVVPPLVLPFVP